MPTAPLNFIHLEEAKSTNTYLLTQAQDLPDRTVVYTWRQTAGRGQKGNSWESEPGMNLAFSLLLKRPPVEIKKQFCISEAVSIAICDCLSQFADGFKVKWPNDIYHHDRKICGILIENSLEGTKIAHSVIGVGININQTLFVSDAPNPVSLCQIIGHEVDLEQLLSALLDSFCSYYQMIEQGQYDAISGLYHLALYRAHGFYRFRDAQGEFEGSIIEVEDTGRMIMRDKQGMIREYMFKEIEFII